MSESSNGGFQQVMHSPAVILLAAILGLTGTGFGILKPSVSTTDVEELVVAGIQRDRAERQVGLEPKAVFVHRIDQDHERCMMSAPQLNGDNPEWARVMVQVQHFSRCDLQRISEIVWRGVE